MFEKEQKFPIYISAVDFMMQSNEVWYFANKVYNIKQTNDIYTSWLQSDRELYRFFPYETKKKKKNELLAHIMHLCSPIRSWFVLLLLFHLLNFIS